MCSISIATIFANKAWDGFVKFENYLLVEKNITTYSVGKIHFYMIVKNLQSKIFYKISGTTTYKTFFISNTNIDSIVEVTPEKTETTVYQCPQEILDDIIKSIE